MKTGATVLIVALILGGVIGFLAGVAVKHDKAQVAATAGAVAGATQSEPAFAHVESPTAEPVIPVTTRTIRYLPRDHGLSADVAERLRRFASVMHDAVLQELADVAEVVQVDKATREVHVTLSPETVAALEDQFMAGCVKIMGDELAGHEDVVAALESTLLYLGKYPLEWTFIAVDGDFANSERIQWAQTTRYPPGHEIKSSIIGGLYHREGFVADYAALAAKVIGG